MTRVLKKDNLTFPSVDERQEEARWTFYNVANCYSYAINFLQDVSHLNPGEIAGLDRQETYSDEELVKRVRMDVEAAGFTMRESSFEENLEDIESWKIAIMNCSQEDRFYDFHFLREGRDMQWMHKVPDAQFASKYDKMFKVIKDPAEARYHYNYHLVGYFVISK